MQATAGNGYYWRDDDGIWRYSPEGDPVPGARDRLLWDRHQGYRRREVEGVRYVELPAARVSACPELAAACCKPGALAEDVDGEPVYFLVPEVNWQPTDELDPAGGMWAPELEPSQLLDLRAFAALMGYTSIPGVESRLSKGLLPRPVVTLPQTGRPRGPRIFWTRPVLERWAERTRRRRMVPIVANARAARRERLGLPPLLPALAR